MKEKALDIIFFFAIHRRAEEGVFIRAQVYAQKGCLKNDYHFILAYNRHHHLCSRHADLGVDAGRLDRIYRGFRPGFCGIPGDRP